MMAHCYTCGRTRRVELYGGYPRCLSCRCQIRDRRRKALRAAHRRGAFRLSYGGMVRRLRAELAGAPPSAECLKRAAAWRGGCRVGKKGVGDGE